MRIYQNKIPKLRFRRFNNDWQEKKLGELLNVGSVRDYKHLNNGDVPVYGTGGLMLYVDDYLYDGKSVGIGRKGTIDKPQFLRGKFWTVDTLFYTHSYKDAVPEFMYAIFQKINWQKYNEASGVPSLSKSTIEKIPVIVPGKEEQQKIADFLGAVDEKIKRLQKKKELLEKYKKGMMQKIFSQELRFRDENGQEFPDWGKSSLEDIADVKGGKRIPKGHSLQSEDNGLPYITVSDFRNGSVKLEGIRYVPSNVQKDIQNYTISSDDIYISVAGTLGLIGTIPKELDGANLTENANKITNIKISKPYLTYYLHTPTFKKLVENTKTDNAQPKLAIYSIKGLKVAVPSNVEQRKIADFLTLLDTKNQQEKRRLEKTELFKESLFQKMFV